jgi:hypothetical protein
MKDAYAGLRRELGEPDGFAVARIEEPANTLHELNLRIDYVRSFRLATQTRAEACLFGSLGQIEKLDAFAMCAA